MEKILITDMRGNIISAKLIFAFYSNETQKSYVALNNSDLIFHQNSSYANLDIFEITKEENNIFYVSDILDEEWEIVKNTITQEILAKIKET